MLTVAFVMALPLLSVNLTANESPSFIFSLDIAKELFQQDTIMKLLEDHKNGIKDNYRRIWAIYSFLKWYEVFFIHMDS